MIEIQNRFSKKNYLEKRVLENPERDVGRYKENAQNRLIHTKSKCLAQNQYINYKLKQEIERSGCQTPFRIVVS